MGFITSAGKETDLNVKYGHITSSGEAERLMQENLDSSIKMFMERWQDLCCSTSLATGLLPGYLSIPIADGKLCISVVAGCQKGVHH